MNSNIYYIKHTMVEQIRKNHLIKFIFLLQRRFRKFVIGGLKYNIRDTDYKGLFSFSVVKVFRAFVIRMF